MSAAVRLSRLLPLLAPALLATACLNTVGTADDDDGDGPPGPQDQGADTGWSGGDGGSGGDDAGGDTGTAGESEIARIQQYDGYAENDVVTVSGVVSTPNTGSGFFIADAPGPWASVWVYHGGGSTAVQGDTVEVTGTLIEFNELTEIDAAKGSVAVTGTGTVPAPTVVAVDALVADPEPYEGVIVRLEDVTVTDDLPDAPEDYGEFVVDDLLRVDDYFHDAAPVQGDSFSRLTGPLIYTFGQFKLAPRYPADVEE